MEADEEMVKMLSKCTINRATLQKDRLSVDHLSYICSLTIAEIVRYAEIINFIVITIIPNNNRNDAL
ncbi:hypothetical protein WN48_00943 [Eufriesea mexicana]|uniref:Uncharacterized protein n=1 Tax=Eufriesea mexicana TaxID=516756 RepID=A0A310SCT0_9HYME|nr:hypothetical protein WN48_00943 [Eufriesea mexicana]